VEGNDKIELELEATVYNINKGRNPSLEERSVSLSGYAELIALARENEKARMEKDAAVRDAVKRCIKEGVLGGFLKKHGSEVENMLLTEWNWDDALAVSKQEGWEEGWEQGIEKSIEKGREKTREEDRKLVFSLIEKARSVDELKKMLEDKMKQQ
jgi:hypothetical protein